MPPATPPSTFFLDQSESQKRQYIDAETVFLALGKARKAAAEVRGSMLWRDLRGKSTLIRTSATGAQKSLGLRSTETEAIYASFMARKQSAEERHKALKTQLATQQRLNRALRVGRVPNVVVGVINALDNIGVQDHFMVVSTHALYAYETAAGVRIAEEAMATRDVDILFDTRKRISFFTAMKKLDSSLIGVLRKVDPSFEVVEDQLYTARNKDGFEVDIIRRAAKDADPHPLQSARRMDQVVVATSGEMALMRTVHPLDFARIKLELSRQVGRDPNKSGKDALQSRIVTELVNEYLPHFLPTEGESPLVQ
jgi:hypothetical protein